MIDADDFECDSYQVNRDDPFSGLFERLPAKCRYVLNHSKKEYYDLTRTRKTYTDEKGAYTHRIDPLPLLFAYGGAAYDKCTGLWIGDEIEPSDELPEDGYKDMSSVYCWDGVGED